MVSLHPPALQGPMLYACAQAGCPVCVEHLLQLHEPLLHTILHRQYCFSDDVGYADLLQEARLALWRAIQGYDPARGWAFSTYAGAVIEHRLWTVLEQARRRTGFPVLVGCWLSRRAPNPAECLEQREIRAAWQRALAQTCQTLPLLGREALLAYGLAGRQPQSLAQLARRFGVTRENMRWWRNQALVQLRVQLLAGPYLSLTGRDTRATYQRLLDLNRVWRRHRRGRTACWAAAQRRGGRA